MRGVSPHPGLFGGQVVIAVTSWDWNLRVGAPPARGLSGVSEPMRDRDFALAGRVYAPEAACGKTFKARLTPFGPKVRFGRKGQQALGEIRISPAGAEDEIQAVLMLPEAAIATTALSLTSHWRFLQVHTRNETSDSAEVKAYFFQREMPSAFSDRTDAG